jgi:hypothetical protein
MTMRREITAAETGTRATIGAENVREAIPAEDHTVGLACLLANLAAHLQ